MTIPLRQYTNAARINTGLRPTESLKVETTGLTKKEVTEYNEKAAVE
jgi:hypothetical protein